MARRGFAERFWAKVDRAAGGCWPWMASLDSHGYGQIFIGRGSAPGRAPRIAYELLVGPIPEGLELDHLCRNRRCVNPAHLEAVTPHENWRRGESPTAVNSRKTRCPRGHALAGKNLVQSKLPRRVCRECHTASQRRAA